MLILKQSTASQSVLLGPFVDDTDGATAETGLTIANTDIRLSKNGGNMAAKNSGGGTHDENGWYTITLDATDTNTVGRLQVSCKVAGALAVFMECQVVEEAIYDALFATSAAGFDANGRVDVGSWLGTAAATPTTAGVPEVDVTYAAGTAWGSGAITAGSIATGAIDADALATDAVDEIVDAVWDEDILAAHTTTATAGLILANTRNLATGAGGISVTMSSHTATDVGTETNSETDTAALDGVYHICPPGTNLDMYYEFDVGVTGIATEAIWDGYVTTNNDVCEVYGYDWVAAGWVQIGTINGTSGTTAQEKIFILDNTMTGTGANVGKVRIRFDSDGGDLVTNVATDRILVEYTSLPGAGVDLHDGVAQASTSNTITLDAAASAVDDFYNHARVVITEGKGSEQERLITDYNGTTKVATVAPPWATNPDTTSVFIVEPALAHSETDMDTLKIGLAAAATSTTITLDSNANATDDFYNGDLIVIDAGTGAGQVRVITDYTGATKVATVHTAWTTTPDTTSEYVVEAAHPYLVDIEADATAILADTGTDGVVIASGQTVATVTDVTNEVSADVTKISGNATAADNLEESAKGIITGATSGTPTTTVIDTDLTGYLDDELIGRVVVFVSGTAAGQASDITDYAQTNGVLTVTALATAPAASDTFVIV